MKLARCATRSHRAWALLVTPVLMLAPRAGGAAEPLKFQRPKIAASHSGVAGPKFRQSPAAAETARVAKPLPVQRTSTNTLRSETTSAPAPRVAAKTVMVKQAKQAFEPVVEATYNSDAAVEPLVLEQAPSVRRAAPTSRPSFMEAQAEFKSAPVRRAVVQSTSDDAGSVEPAAYRRRMLPPSFLGGQAEMVGFCAGCEGSVDPGCGICEPECGIAEPECGIVEPGCGLAEPACGIAEPGCGIVEPGCGIVEPGCGIMEPECGIAEPSCGCDDVGCGSCVGHPGADYWCFPVCFPRFKELSVWGGVHGFKGPRDSIDGSGDGNFGFQEGINIGGRAPFISLLFPQLGYQLGYQAVQSQLSGNSGGSTVDRSQNFVTAGVFRRVRSGLQAGIAWDYMKDDFVADAEFSQVRYEVSLKGRTGREIGFWGATHASDDTVNGTVYQTVDQYAGFIRWSFREGGLARIWAGGTNDSEAIVGADIYAPLNNRWSVQTGFNYLITDAANGEIGAREESWNVGMNVAWHFGCVAKKSASNPFMPLFSTADNGWMFIDTKP